MKKNFLHSFFLTTVLLLASCSPKATIVNLRLPTIDQENNPRQIVSWEYEKVHFTCDYLQSTPFDLIFEVEFTNKSDSLIYFDPVESHIDAIGSQGKALDASSAYHPDQLVLDLEKAIEIDRKNLRAERGFGWLVAGLNVVSAVSSFADDEEEAGVAYSLEAATALITSSMSKSSIKKNLSNLEFQRDFYDKSALRSQYLEPGQSMRGLVIFPRFDQARQIDVSFYIGDLAFSVLYDQVHLKK